MPLLKRQPFKAKIAVATVSGKAYYLLVNELKKRQLPFLSLMPNDKMPVDVKVVLTTEKESAKIIHPIVLEFREDENPAEVVDEAVRALKGKKVYEKLVVGIDPGQNLGVAVLGDGIILETGNCKSIAEALRAIEDILRRIPATRRTIRIGDGPPAIAEELWLLLDNILPAHVTVEIVKEDGTSQPYRENSNRRDTKDILSAIKIGQRQGHVLPRSKKSK